MLVYLDVITLLLVAFILVLAHMDQETAKPLAMDPTRDSAAADSQPQPEPLIQRYDDGLLDGSPNWPLRTCC